MPDRTPGVERAERISDEGLKRLERQLASGSQVSDAVLAQWIVRYGDAARELVREHGRYHDGLEKPVLPPHRDRPA